MTILILRMFYSVHYDSACYIPWFLLDPRYVGDCALLYSVNVGKGSANKGPPVHRNIQFFLALGSKLAVMQMIKTYTSI